MQNILKIKIENKKGFTLVETMVGLTILTIAIVAATSLLIGLLSSNKNIVKTLQAHYLAQEGLEAVRNIRDTNWIHNLDWKGSRDFLGVLNYDVVSNQTKEYAVGLNMDAVNIVGNVVPVENKQGLAKSWFLQDSVPNFAINFCEYSGNSYFSNNCSGATPTDFERHIEISKPPYCLLPERADDSLCGNAILVKSIVKFGDKEVSLEEVLTNWKGGVL